MIQSCADIFSLDLLTICLQIKLLLIELICFHHIVLMKVRNIEKNNKNNNKKMGEPPKMYVINGT